MVPLSEQSFYHKTNVTILSHTIFGEIKLNVNFFNQHVETHLWISFFIMICKMSDYTPLLITKSLFLSH